MPNLELHAADVRTAICERLADARPSLSARDQGVVDSLISWAQRRGSLTPAQAGLANTLCERANRPAPVAQAIGELRGVVELLERAGQRLRFPALLVMADGLRPLRLTLATRRAQVPGSITVTSVTRHHFGEREWYGRVTREGEFQPANRLTAEMVQAITNALRAVAADPAAAAAHYGHLTGHCCCCGAQLDDERSTAVGYGPTCATNWGLPWGARAARTAAAARPAPAVPAPAPVPPPAAAVRLAGKAGRWNFAEELKG